MTTKLRARLIGAWQLVSFSFDPVDGSDAMPPLGPRPTGLLVYTESGFMSAQISGANRPKVASGDWSQAAPGSMPPWLRPISPTPAPLKWTKTAAA